MFADLLEDSNVSTAVVRRDLRAILASKSRRVDPTRRERKEWMETMSEKILLVDDEPNVLRACERLLHNRFETDAAVGGVEALTAINTKGPYAVVLSDMRMPQMDGLQLLTRIKSIAPDTSPNHADRVCGCPERADRGERR